MNDFITAVILGVVEGITEYLPVSSTGHMILVGDVLHFTGERAETFEVFIQLGAILAVVFLYFRRFIGLLDFSSVDSNGLKGKDGLIKIGAACLPVFVLGLLFRKAIKEHLFSTPTVAYALIFGGILMILVESLNRPARVTKVEDLTIPDAIKIGIFQCLALWPGMSRSGSTMIGGLFLGIQRTVAAEFSFLVAVPVMCAAVGYDMLKSIHLLSIADIPVFAAGFIVSFFVAIIAVKSFIAILGRYTLKPFGIYRILVGIVVLLAI